MKILNLLSIIVVSVISSGMLQLRAEEKSPAVQLMDEMEFTKTAKSAAAKTFDIAMQNMKAKGLPEEGLAEMKEAADRFFAKVFDSEDFRDDFAKIYEGAYTKEEMLELIKFYKTPLGKKTLTVMTTVMEQSMELGQKHAQIHQADFQAEVQAIMLKYQPANTKK